MQNTDYFSKTVIVSFVRLLKIGGSITRILRLHASELLTRVSTVVLNGLGDRSGYALPSARVIFIFVHVANKLKKK